MVSVDKVSAFGSYSNRDMVTNAAVDAFARRMTRTTSTRRCRTMTKDAEEIKRIFSSIDPKKELTKYVTDYVEKANLEGKKFDNKGLNDNIVEVIRELHIS